MGYILRLAESNYYETPKWILELAGLKMDNLRNGWRKLCGDSIDFTLFKQITGLSEAEVNEILTCVRVAGNGSPGIGRASVSVAVAVIGVRPYALNYRRRSVGPCAA
jgi:hypothetical protein